MKSSHGPTIPRPHTHDYRRLEDRLFDELRVAVYERVGEADRRALNRYSAGSLADPTAYPENGNRTYDLPVEQPRAAVLMIHGLSDSPYVLRALGERLHQRGCWVVGLRLPGHGTAPSALKTVRWEDWAAAVRLAAKISADELVPMCRSTSSASLPARHCRWNTP